MDDQTFMEVLLFAHLNPSDKKRKLLLNPNFAQGINISKQNGEVLYSIQPGVSTEGASLLDASGDKIATIREGVHDQVVYDFGLGETAVSMPDVFGGSKVLDHGEGFIGFTRPAFDGGLALENRLHQRTASMDGGEIALERKAEVADFNTVMTGNSFGPSSELFEAVDATSEADDMMDVLDAADVLGDLF